MLSTFRFILIISLVCLCKGLYEDQIGKFDWRHQFIGKVKHISLDNSGSSTRQIFLASEANIVASINLRDGDIVWRQILEEDGTLGNFLHCGSNLYTISQLNRTVLRAWNTALGHLQFEVLISESGSPPISMMCDSSKGELLVLNKNHLVAVSFKDGSSLWTQELPQLSAADDVKIVSSSRGEIFAIGLKSSRNIDYSILSSNGALKSHHSVSSPWLKNLESCIYIESYNSLICLNRAKNLELSTLVIQSGSQWESQSLESFGMQLSNRMPEIRLLQDSYFIVTDAGSQTAFVFSKSKSIKLEYKLTKVSVITAASFLQENYIIVGYHTNEPFRNFDVKVYYMSTGNEISKLASSMHIAQHHGQPRKIEALVFSKKDGSVGFRLLLFTEDDAVQLIQQSGRSIWVREESLASIVSVEIVDLPVSENQAKMEEEFGHNQGNIIEMFVKRVTTQLSQFKAFLQDQIRRQHWRNHYFPDNPDAQYDENTGNAAADDTEESKEELDLTRDDFNLHKMIVAVTGTGKLFGIETLRGRIIWKYLIPNAVPFNENRAPLFLQRTTAHFPLQPYCSVVMRNKASLKPILFSFDPVNGVPIIDKSKSPSLDYTELPYDIMQAVMISVMNEPDYMRPIVLMDKQAKVHIFPEAYNLNVSAHPIFLHLMEPVDGRINGYRVKENPTSSGRFVAEPIWKLYLGRQSLTPTVLSQHIVATAAKPLLEHVHSVGRILGDRTVLYKYLNPNLLSVITETTDKDIQKNFITMYLIDIVVGQVVYSTQHKRCSGPVNIIHSENWIVYSYYNQKSFRFEMAVLELFEKDNTQGGSYFSSLTRDELAPEVLKQAYILTTPVRTIAASITEKGITSKSIILALNSGGLLELPKALLDPRRSLDMTVELQEEGVEPYIPELPNWPHAMLNYNMSVMSIRGIYTAPSGLESTSLVFAYGMDLFFSRVSPSKMYDVLKEDFDYFFIGTVTLGMIVASFVTQKLAARKALFRAWQ